MFESLRIAHGLRLGLTVAVIGIGAAGASAAEPDADELRAPRQRPILFVTQVPVVQFTGVVEAFGAHRGPVDIAPRGGDLFIRYPDGTTRNLTREAGFGKVGSQDGTGIAVRQPVVDWSGTKAMFSMVVGAPTQRFQVAQYRWQLYEVRGLQQGGTAVITPVPCQPAGNNNIAPVYGSDESVIFVSDRPRNGAASLYPQRDEYESTAVESGLWKLSPASCQLKLLEHAPSGVTYPSIDSYGRLLFTKWDHLQRDQQADADVFDNAEYQSFNFASEAATTPPATQNRNEFYPELRLPEYSLLPGAGYDGVSIAPDYPFGALNFNHFFPWMLNQDGSGEETLNHVGRHELGGSYANPYFRNDPALHDITYGRYNGATTFLGGSGGAFHLREDPRERGLMWAIRAPEFATATAGDLVQIEGAPDVNPEVMKLTLVGDKDILGRFRNPLPTSDGRMFVVHTPNSGDEVNSGTSTNPVINYALRIRQFDVDTRSLGAFLTAGFDTCVSYWNPDERVSWCGTLWELDPVEVVARKKPARTLAPDLPTPEAQVLRASGVQEKLLRNWLHSRSLALIVSRDVTTRDRADDSQPYNLAIAGGGAQTIGHAGGHIYPVSHLQLFQGDQIRGYYGGGFPTPQPGRRVLAVPLHDPAAIQAMGTFPTGPQGSVPLAADGSMAAFVPAGRALSWQLVDSSKTGWDKAVVRERNWLSFKPGERRVCTSCHGVNTVDQSGQPAPTNPPQALATLLQQWKQVVRNNCPATGGTGNWKYPAEWSACDERQRYRIQVCMGGNGCCDGLPKTATGTCSN